MIDGKEDMAELAREIERLIADNRKFLERVMDDGFEPEEEEDGEDEEIG